jgi:hypothetical protein
MMAGAEKGARRPLGSSIVPHRLLNHPDRTATRNDFPSQVFARHAGVVGRNMTEMDGIGKRIAGRAIAQFLSGREEPASAFTAWEAPASTTCMEGDIE